ncbi:putative E3 ubiquitin-protein ligase RING1-like [Iris pallida]|uniref:RING-type E3 ubiquitin transferase n=1 Tax=Iris pallida TaxID=29817 RepID=A0AAX6HYK8_IRIPA|nr:putative E3 ubiquitin-protein ligase RING1-like [Iris pallida]
MSSSASTATAHRQYFCHQCDRTVSIPAPSSSGELSCPLCNGGFIEEFDLSSHSHPPPSNLFPNPNDFPPLQPSIDIRSLLSAPFPAGPGPEPFNAMALLQNYLNAYIEGGPGTGANIQLVFEDGAGAGGPFGDYFVGHGFGLEQLIQHLADNDPNRYGTPPASKSAVDALPDVKITAEMFSSDDDAALCAVCKDEFEIGSDTKQMPCKHLYHPECIMPWLELHNSCPVCRYELPTEDPDYESRRTGEQGAAPAAAAGRIGLASLVGGEGLPEGAQAAGRRYSVHIPWQLRATGAQAEASNAGNNNAGDAVAGSSGGRGSSEPETRQEDLD